MGASAGGVEALHVVVGVSLVQSPAGAQFPVMPNRAIREDDVDAALTLAATAQALTVMADGGAFEPGSSHAVVPRGDRARSGARGCGPPQPRVRRWWS